MSSARWAQTYLWEACQHLVRKAAICSCLEALRQSPSMPHQGERVGSSTRVSTAFGALTKGLATENATPTLSELALTCSSCCTIDCRSSTD